MSEFQYAPYRNPYVTSIADLMLRPGEAQARAAQISGNAQANAAMQSGQAWGNAAQTIGQTVAAIPQQMQQAKIHALQAEEAQQAVDRGKRAAADMQALDQAYLQPGGREAIINALPGHLRPQVSKQFTEADEAAAKVQETALKVTESQNDYFGGLAANIRDHQYDPLATQLAISHAKQTYASNPEMLKQIGLLEQTFQSDPTKIQPVVDQLISVSMKQKAADSAALSARARQTAADKPTTATLAVDAANGDPTATAALETLKPPVQTSAQTKSVLLDGKPAEVLIDPKTRAITDLSGAPIENAAQRIKPVPPAAVQVNNAPAAAEARTNNAQQVVEGNMPPSMLSKRAADYNATLAEANKINIARTGKPINIGKLQLDYEAAKKFVSGMNSNQMIRYRGLSQSVVNTIDEVQRLADQLQQGGVQKWNSVTRGTIRQVYGNTPQSELANQYVGAVNTLKEEFANLANGGYAPTDAAWKLANDQINQDFGFKDLRASLTEVQRLINFRSAAFTDQQPFTMGGQTPAPASNSAPPSNANPFR